MKDTNGTSAARGIAWARYRSERPNQAVRGLRFAVRVHDVGGRPLDTSRAVRSPDDITRAWCECCRIVARAHGLERMPSDWLAATPAVEDARRYLASIVVDGEPVTDELVTM